MRKYLLLSLFAGLPLFPNSAFAQGQNPEKDADLVIVAVCNGATPTTGTGSAMVWFRSPEGEVNSGAGMDISCTAQNRTNVTTLAHNFPGYTLAYWIINVTIEGGGDPKTCLGSGTELPARFTCTTTDKRTLRIEISGGESQGGQ
jgi:hypothetical protein